MEGPPLSEMQAMAKWLEVAPLLDRLLERIDTEDEFPVSPRSSLAGDADADPYQVSHAVRLCITAADHLHAVKVLIIDQRVIHVAAPATLARGALENLAAAFWILHPPRNERVTRALRWHDPSVKDTNMAVSGPDLPGSRPLEVRLAQLDAVATRRSLDASLIRRGYTSTAVMTYA